MFWHIIVYAGIEETTTSARRLTTQQYFITPNYNKRNILIFDLQYYTLVLTLVNNMYSPPFPSCNFGQYKGKEEKSSECKYLT
jgi:hypothetical protein